MASTVSQSIVSASVDPEKVDWTNGMTKAPRNVAWYQASLTRVPDIARQIFREYSKIPDEKVLDHIYQIRDRAWDM